MKKIVIVSSAFYPTPVVGAVRVTNWARMLASHGYEVHVVTRDTGHGTTPGQLADQLGTTVEVLSLDQSGKPTPHEPRKPEGPEPRRKGSWKHWALLHATAWWIPDPSIRYWQTIYPQVLELVRQRECDAVLTTSPHGSTTEVGRWLQRDLNLPWVADFRDPPLLDKRSRPRGLGKLLMPRHRAWLDRVYHSADAVLHAIPVHARWARLTYPNRRTRFATLRHPVPDELANREVEPIGPAVEGRRTIGVVGALQLQALLPIAQAIDLLVTRDPTEYDLELRLVGRPLDNAGPLQEILGNRLNAVGRVPNPVAKQHMVGSDVLLNALTLERQQYLGVSSKLFEYAGARRPILTLNPTSCDRELLRQLPSQVIDEPTVEQLVELLAQALGQQRQSVEADFEPFIKRHSWQRHSERLIEMLHKVTDPAGNSFDLREL